MTPPDHQIALRFAASAEQPSAERWLGLVVDHRTLFEALSDGWLRPPRQRKGLLVGVGAYALEQGERPRGKRVPVRVKLDRKALPALDVAVFRDGRWTTAAIQDIRPSDQTVYWPGVLPTFVVSQLTVSTEEERSRLLQMTRITSNLDLREVPVYVGAATDEILEPSISPPDLAPKLEVPDCEDAIHGALSLAVWGVPRMAPWMDLLIASLGPDRERLARSAQAVEAPWWRFPPWYHSTDVGCLSCPQECLWLAAIDVFRDGSSEDVGRGRDLADRIVANASRYGDQAVVDVIRNWQEATHRALRGQTEISIEQWRTDPVGIALQLVLTRPRPVIFKGWFKQRPDLPPAVAWSATALCGLLFGYRRLDTEFRGGPVQQQVLSIYALHASYGGGSNTGWPAVTNAEPSWRRDDGELVLSWGSRDFTRKREKARGRWIAADFEDERVIWEATQAAKQLNWPCLSKRLTLIDQALPITGPGTVELASSQSQLDIRGSVQMTLPDGISIEERLDIGKFRQLVAVERGPLPEPPPATAARGRPEEIQDVPGLVYRPDFLGPGEADQLVAMIDDCVWETDLRRRVQHFGWRYSYRTRKVDTSMRLGQLPRWADEIAHRLVAEGLLKVLPDQVIVNEYRGNQGIAKHIDHKEHFADGIVMISLMEPWEMIFRGPDGKSKIGKVLAPGSVAAMHGDARYIWTHEIPRRKNEPGWGRRNRRLSLTFRKVLLP